jgi:hypothetical protein
VLPETRAPNSLVGEVSEVSEVEKVSVVTSLTSLTSGSGERDIASGPGDHRVNKVFRNYI